MATYDLKYPGAAIDAILDTAYHLQQAGYIFRGSASDYSGTPTEREWVIAPAGFTGLGLSSAVPKGSIGICLYNGTSWVGKIVNVVTIDSSVSDSSDNAVSSSAVYAAINQLATGVAEALDNLTFTDSTPSAFQDDYIYMKVSTTDGGVERILTYLTILSATTSKAGLMSAEDKAKVDSFLTGIRSMQFVDATTSAEQSIKLVEQLKWTVGGVQEVIDSITILAATSSKAGLLSASDKAYIDALPATLTSLSNSISGALALMQSLVGYYVCDTAAGTAAKTVAATGYSLTNGGCIRIKMNNANTANNVTLNINSTGAKALYYDGAQASSTNTWEAGEVLEVYYDGTQYQCASGGGGKFSTGEKVNEVGITDELEHDSDNLVTSGCVFDSLYEAQGGGGQGEQVTPSSLSPNPSHFIINSSGSWVTSTNNTTYSVSLRLIAASSLTIKKGINAAGIAYAFLRTNNYSSNVYADFATGYSQVILNTTDDVINLTIPDNAQYLYYTRLLSGTNYEPREIIIGELTYVEKYAHQSDFNKFADTPFVDMNLDNVIFNHPNDVISHGSQEKWIEGNNCQTVMMPCKGCPSARIIPDGNYSIAYACLKSKDYEIGDVADYATGYTQVIVTSDTAEFDIPSDAQYIYIVYIFGGTNYKPSKVYLKGTMAIQQDIDNRMYELEHNNVEVRKIADVLVRNFNIISHLAGGSFYGNVAPMNSMWSAMLAARMGMRCCEFDIVFTSDDVPICCHDLNISTSGNNEFVKKDGTPISGSTPIGTLTYQQIMDTYEYRQGFNGYKQISTLYDVLRVYRDNDIIPCLEIKNPATEMTSERYEIVLNALHDAAGKDFMIVMFDIDNAIALRNMDDEALIGISNTTFSQSMITIAQQYNFFCGLYISNITTSIVETFKESGVDLYGWTIGTDVNAALELGLRYFICDYIAEPKNTAGVTDMYISNALDFSNITHTGNVQDNHLILASGQSATIQSSISTWLNSVEVHLIIKGTCTIRVGTINYSVSNSDFGEYVILLREYNKTSESVVINGVCEIASIVCEFKSY